MATRKKKKPLLLVQKIMITIISFLFTIVILLCISSIFLNPEARVKSKISKLASNYYESYIYENLKNSDKVKDFEKTIENYKDYGFSNITLRQLIYFDDNTETINFLKKYCDENKTYVKIYPEPPYSKTSYHIDYHYACEF